MKKIIPEKGECRLLEAGCGSGVYIKRACERNPFLRAVGVEFQKDTADFARKNTKKWQIADRVTIEHQDIRKYRSKAPFDLITFFNLIYYFPETERIDLLTRLTTLLMDKGRLVLTTLCPAKDPSIQLMNL